MPIDYYLRTREAILGTDGMAPKAILVLRFPFGLIGSAAPDARHRVLRQVAGAQPAMVAANTMLARSGV
jgi:hypothetical protein